MSRVEYEFFSNLTHEATRELQLEANKNISPLLPTAGVSQVPQKESEPLAQAHTQDNEYEDKFEQYEDSTIWTTIPRLTSVIKEPWSFKCNSCKFLNEGTIDDGVAKCVMCNRWSQEQLSRIANESLGIPEHIVGLLAELLARGQEKALHAPNSVLIDLDSLKEIQMSHNMVQVIAILARNAPSVALGIVLMELSLAVSSSFAAPLLSLAFELFQKDPNATVSATFIARFNWSMMQVNSKDRGPEWTKNALASCTKALEGLKQGFEDFDCLKILQSNISELSQL